MNRKKLFWCVLVLALVVLIPAGLSAQNIQVAGNRYESDNLADASQRALGLRYTEIYEFTATEIRMIATYFYSGGDEIIIASIKSNGFEPNVPKVDRKGTYEYEEPNVIGIDFDDGGYQRWTVREDGLYHQRGMVLKKK